MEQDVFVGVDVAKKELVVHVRPSGASFAVARDSEGLIALTERLRAMGPKLVVLEATGGYEQVAAAAIAGEGVALAVVNPRQIRDFARASGRAAKTDKIDAAVIAHFAEAVRPPARPLADAARQALAALVARRRQLLQMMVAESNRKEHTAQPRLIRSIQRVQATLQQELTDLDRELGDVIRSTPLWQAHEDLLTSVPGIAEKTARALIATLPELGTLTRRQIAHLAGLAPISRDSGAQRGQRTIRGGRAAARTALYMAALTATHHNPVISDFYQRLLAAGKAKKRALVAAMRKLLTIVNAIIREQKPWRHA